MKSHLFAAFFCMAILSGCGGGSSSENNSELTQMVETEWSNYTKTLPASDGGLALYMVTPKGSYFASTGIEDASPNTHFRVASNTKTFTAASIMLLNQERKLKIDDSITSLIPGTTEPYVPDTSDYAIPYKNQITIRQLLAHRAGVFDIGNNTVPQSCNAPYAGQSYSSYVRQTDENHSFNTDELISVVARCRLSFFPPGTDYHYSNTGYSMLAKIIERVSGLRYAEFVQQKLLTPNKLSETTVPYLGTDRAIPEPFAPGSLISQGELYHWTEDNMSENLAEGNIISTPADLAKWVRLLINGEAGLSKETVSRMTECASTTSDTTCYGLGISEILQPIIGLGHSGAHAGYLSLMVHDPVANVTTIIFSNFLNFDDPQAEMQIQATVREKAYSVLGL